MFESVKKMEKRSIWLLVAVFLSILLIVFVYPQIRAIRLQSKAGEIIEEYVAQVQQEQPEIAVGNFYCIIPILQAGSLEGNNLDQAILWLNQAKSLAPNNVHSSFLLGQAYCLNEEYEQAVDVLNEFLILRPANQLARAEVGFAYTSMARSTTDPQVAQTYQSTSLQYLEKAGFSLNNFSKFADDSYKQERPRDALFWYGFSDSISPLPDPLLFRYILLNLVFEGSNPTTDQMKEGMILELADELTVEPSSFFELSTGSSFQTGTNNGKAMVTLASNGQHAGTLLNVIEANRFCFSIFALDKPPQPTQIGVDLDFKKFTTLELVNGNGEWVQLDFEVYLDQGFHLLGVKLLNDLYIAGEIDRNAYIGPVKIEACQKD